MVIISYMIRKTKLPNYLCSMGMAAAVCLSCDLAV